MFRISAYAIELQLKLLLAGISDFYSLYILYTYIIYRDCWNAPRHINVKVFLLTWGKIYLALIFRLLFATVRRFSLFFGFLMTFHFSPRDKQTERERVRGRVWVWEMQMERERVSESEVSRWSVMTTTRPSSRKSECEMLAETRWLRLIIRVQICCVDCDVAAWLSIASLPAKVEQERGRLRKREREREGSCLA